MSLRINWIIGAIALSCAPFMAAASDNADIGLAEPLTDEQVVAAKDNGNEVICRREPVLGTLMQRKVCRTRAEIDAERAAAESSMRTLRDQSGYRSGQSVE